MEEHIKFQGRLAINRSKRVEVTVRMKGIVRSLRDLLDPILEEEYLETEMILAQASVLAELRVQYQELLKEAESISRILGR